MSVSVSVLVRVDDYYYKKKKKQKREAFIYEHDESNCLHDLVAINSLILNKLCGNKIFILFVFKVLMKTVF